MGEGEALVYPALLVGLKVIVRELPRGEEDLAFLAVDLVAVDIHVREDVLRALGLDVVESVAERAVIPETHVLQDLGIGFDVGEGGDGLGGEFLLLNRLEAEGEAGGGDVALDELGLAGQFIRLDGESLNDGGVDDGADDADGEQQRHGAAGVTQALMERPSQ